MNLQFSVLSFIGIFAAASAVMLCISPEAKIWACEVIERLAYILCSELQARAKAQLAARATWERIYRKERGAGNWTPAAPAKSLVNCGMAAASSIAAIPLPVMRTERALETR